MYMGRMALRGLLHCQFALTTGLRVIKIQESIAVLRSDLIIITEVYEAPGA